MKRVLVIDAPEAATVKKMFINNGWNTESLDEPNLVCFVGGEDVSPSLYGEKNTSSYDCNEGRDLREAFLFDDYKDIPKVGICRGGQFLNVMSGGKMIQDIKGHRMCFHEIMDLEKDKYLWIKGDHHQGMVPKTPFNIISIACDDLNTPEVLWYPETKSLCFQPHPEWEHKPTEQYFFELINRYFNL